MAEPKYQITTEVSEKDFRRALKVSCSKKGTVEFLLLALMEIFFAFHYWFSYSPKILTISIGFILFILGILSFVWAIRLPERYVRENIQTRRVMSGKSSVREELQFLEDEILIHNVDVQKDYHVPYAYITRIYLFEDMLVYTVDPGVGEIMKRDMPNEAEFIQWFISRCSEAKVKTVAD